jgi:PHP family Zn ribbon phosphoesterase
MKMDINVTIWMEKVIQQTKCIEFDEYISLIINLKENDEYRNVEIMLYFKNIQQVKEFIRKLQQSIQNRTKVTQT